MDLKRDELFRRLMTDRQLRWCLLQIACYVLAGIAYRRGSWLCIVFFAGYFASWTAWVRRMAADRKESEEGVADDAPFPEGLIRDERDLMRAMK